uniref:Transmembrane protein n=1 Tax=Cacopsylla melanoneura TaxID=428564 RepID=A0A8D8LZA4_9HEMI
MVICVQKQIRLKTFFLFCSNNKFLKLFVIIFLFSINFDFFFKFNLYLPVNFIVQSPFFYIFDMIFFFSLQNNNVSVSVIFLRWEWKINVFFLCLGKIISGTNLSENKDDKLEIDISI